MEKGELKSGDYAVRLWGEMASDDDDDGGGCGTTMVEDYIPFYIRPPPSPNNNRPRILFLAPTFTYIIYGNHIRHNVDSTYHDRCRNAWSSGASQYTTPIITPISTALRRTTIVTPKVAVFATKSRRIRIGSRRRNTLGTPRNTVVLARSTNHDESTFIPAHEEMWTHLDTVSGDGRDDLIRADMVYFETPGGGQVFSVGSITFCGSLAWNDCDDDVSTIVRDILRRFKQNKT